MTSSCKKAARRTRQANFSSFAFWAVRINSNFFPIPQRNNLWISLRLLLKNLSNWRILFICCVHGFLLYNLALLQWLFQEKIRTAVWLRNFFTISNGWTRKKFFSVSRNLSKFKSLKLSELHFWNQNFKKKITTAAWNNHCFFV